MVAADGTRVFERTRVARHLCRAERLLARRDASAFDLLQRANRRLLLGELARYRRAGRFPRNRERRAGLTPVFRDDRGTHCAVAHLLAISGHGEIVERVAASRNLARVRELADLPELRAWLAVVGLTLEEAALIQPSYCDVSMADTCFCSSSGQLAVALAVVDSVESYDKCTVTLERVPDNELGIVSGMQVSVYCAAGFAASVGERIIVGTQGSANSSSELGFTRINNGLQISEDQVTCPHHEFTRTHPLPIDTALSAFQRTPEACNMLLENISPTWGGSAMCAGVDPEDGGAGCRLSVAGGGAAPALTSLAIFAALLLRRRSKR
jgi:hypothetical protein